MPLINCHECKEAISDRAQTCPYCGIHMHLQESFIKNAMPIQTVQETSKYLKGWLAIGYLTSILGLFALANTRGTERDLSWIFIVGVFLIIFTKVSIWWNHK